MQEWRISPRRAYWPVVTVGLGVAIGAGLALTPQVGVALAACLLGAIALGSPSGGWVLSALVAAITFRGLVQLGALPSVATFFDMPLAWGALVSAALRSGAWSPEARTHMRWLGALCLAVLASWAFHPSEVLRPILYVALLGEPFALIGALLIDPPTPRIRTALVRTAIALVAVQVPIAFAQMASAGGNGDLIQGTLYGAGAGSHVMGAIVAVGGLWMLESEFGWAKRLLLALPLVAILFLTDAKQVIFAGPASLLVRPFRASGLLRVAVVAGSLFFLVGYVGAGRTAAGFFEQQTSGQGGKEAVGILVLRELTTDPASVFLGKGPAETVSRSAFMTTDSFLNPNSPLKALHLQPAAIALAAQADALSASGGASSLNSGVSSALGVLGDTGLVGALAYSGLLLSVMLGLRRRDSSIAVAALEGWAILVVLGLVFDWWEQPPIMVLLAVLSGLALTLDSSEHGAGAIATRDVV